MPSAVARETRIGLAAHPNEFDKRRIERSVKSRKRYRYVTPQVMAVDSGYRIESPCCSRNIDPDGGIIDVALLLHDADLGSWQLWRRDHQKAVWEFHSTYARLTDLLAVLNIDAKREFWQ